MRFSSLCAEMRCILRSPCSLICLVWCTVHSAIFARNLSHTQHTASRVALFQREPHMNDGEHVLWLRRDYYNFPASTAINQIGGQAGEEEKDNTHAVEYTFQHNILSFI